jgi:D-alanine transaminase
MIVYYNGQFVSKEKVALSPDDRGFLFADGVYEVIRSYGGKLFKIKEHFNRLAFSLQELRISGLDLGHLKKVAQELIQKNHLEDSDAVIYIQITRGAATRQHAFPDEETSPTVYTAPSLFQPPEDKWATGIKIILVPDIRWLRCDIKSVALLPNVLACQQAREQGADEAVFVRDGAVTEGSHTSFGAVFDGHLVTHPETNHILPGITRSVVLDLCPKLNIPVRESPILAKELNKADELMTLGTTTEVMPVVQVDDRVVGNGKPGPITTKLQLAFYEIARS